MPSTYAHRVFGERVLHRCPQSLASAIREHRQLYDIGLHGPDVLFYYHVLKNCAVNAKGYAMHARPAKEFFETAKAAYAAAADKGAALAYLLGFVCPLRARLRLPRLYREQDRRFARHPYRDRERIRPLPSGSGGEGAAFGRALRTISSPRKRTRASSRPFWASRPSWRKRRFRLCSSTTACCARRTSPSAGSCA